jgi:hypothetical protein
MVTDPPYGVAYDPTWRNRAGVSASARTGAVLNDHRADWREAWALFPGDVAYVWHGALHAATVADSLTACGFAIRAQVIWAKERLVMSRGHYHWQHEPCQPAGTMVQKVIDRGAGSQPARIVEVPIESLCVGDDVVSYMAQHVARMHRWQALAAVDVGEIHPTGVQVLPRDQLLRRHARPRFGVSVTGITRRMMKRRVRGRGAIATLRTNSCYVTVHGNPTTDPPCRPRRHSDA